MLLVHRQTDRLGASHVRLSAKSDIEVLTHGFSKKLANLEAARRKLMQFQTAPGALLLECVPTRYTGS
jgi:hypothetical protein